MTARAPTLFAPVLGNPMKDANDVLQAYGVEGVKRLLDSAMPVAELNAEVDSEAVVEAASCLPRGHYENARSTVAKAIDWRVTALDKERDEQHQRAEEGSQIARALLPIPPTPAACLAAPRGADSVRNPR